MRRVKNSLLSIGLIILFFSCNMGNEKKKITDKLLEDKCQYIENRINKPITANECLCIEDKIANYLSKKHQLSELQELERFSSKLEIALNNYLTEFKVDSCLQTP